MADTPPAAEERCVPCDIVWNILVVGAAVAFGLLALDYMTDGKVTEYLTSAFKNVRPSLAAVIPISGQEAVDDSGS